MLHTKRSDGKWNIHDANNLRYELQKNLPNDLITSLSGFAASEVADPITKAELIEAIINWHHGQNPAELLKFAEKYSKHWGLDQVDPFKLYHEEAEYTAANVFRVC